MYFIGLRKEYLGGEKRGAGKSAFEANLMPTVRRKDPTLKLSKVKDSYIHVTNLSLCELHLSAGTPWRTVQIEVYVSTVNYLSIIIPLDPFFSFRA